MNRTCIINWQVIMKKLHTGIFMMFAYNYVISFYRLKSSSTPFVASLRVELKNGFLLTLWWRINLGRSTDYFSQYYDKLSLSLPAYSWTHTFPIAIDLLTSNGIPIFDSFPFSSDQIYIIFGLYRIFHLLISFKPRSFPSVFISHLNSFWTNPDSWIQIVQCIFSREQLNDPHDFSWSVSP